MLSRNELYLMYLNGETVELPAKPLSRNEIYLARLCGLEVILPIKPLSRIETYLAKLCGEDVTLPAKPLSETEAYLAKLCGEDVALPVSSHSRINALLAIAVANGGWGSTEYTVTYYDYDGTLLGTEVVSGGGNCTEAPVPTRDPDSYEYTFSGWATESGGEAVAGITEDVEADMALYAVYTSVPVPTFRALMSMGLSNYVDEYQISSMAANILSYDTKLVSVFIPKVRTVPNGCFRGDTNLKKLVLPAATSSSSSASFQNCSSLEELRLPVCTANLSSVLHETIVENLKILDVKTGSWNFDVSAKGKNLQYVILRRTSMPTSGVTPAFHPDSLIAKGTGLILVPSSLVNSFKAAAGWSDYAGVIAAIEDHTDIAPSTFTP